MKHEIEILSTPYFVKYKTGTKWITFLGIVGGSEEKIFFCSENKDRVYFRLNNNRTKRFLKSVYAYIDVPLTDIMIILKKIYGIKKYKNHFIIKTENIS